MTAYIKTAGYHVSIQAEPRARRGPTRLFWLGLMLTLAGFVSGYSIARVSEIDAIMIGDSAARTDYAELVNSCFDKNRNATADAMYGCIAAGN